MGSAKQAIAKQARFPRWMRYALTASVWGSLLGGGIAVTGCEEGFDPPSKLNTLRVLGVQADKPYPKPGETVELRMLWHDGKSPVDAPRPVQIVWIGGCFNPAGDLYYLCYPQMAEKLSQIEKDPSLIDKLFGFGDTFSLDIPADIIANRPAVPGAEPYGLSYVFFAACAGQLAPSEPGDDGLPFGCFDETGRRLGADDFVPGYFGLYSFADRTNDNPIVVGLMINGHLIDPSQEPSFPRCTKGACHDLQLRAVVDPESAETNTGLVDSDGRVLSEQMWVEYLATAGKIERSPRLVNDASKGFNEDNGTAYEPPSEVGKQYLFAVVRDNRGGVAWVKQGVWFE
ncbi:MAG: hypothetical protein BWY17_04410 [Deltaproteobacteria bacterium ADurb.Bin207]|nr:MAG: hypothetical protein BWY17_04410 [Deltaproteobacteria bacterium ADurb.Bin207]